MHFSPHIIIQALNTLVPFLSKWDIQYDGKLFSLGLVLFNFAAKGREERRRDK